MKSFVFSLLAAVGAALLTVVLASAKLESMRTEDQKELRALGERVDDFAHKLSHPVVAPASCPTAGVADSDSQAEAIALRVAALLDGKKRGGAPSAPAEPTAPSPSPPGREVAQVLEQAHTVVDRVLSSGRLDHRSFTELREAFRLASGEKDEVASLRQRLIVAINTGVLVSAEPYDFVP